MARKSGRQGGGTSPAQQRLNHARSVDTLLRLLRLNFPDGARLVALAYEPGGYVPDGAYAEPDIVDWLRLSARRLGGAFPYVRSMGPDGVHWVVVALPRAQAEGIAAGWDYGPARVEELEPGQFAALAGQAAGSAGASRRSWKAAKGMRR